MRLLPTIVMIGSLLSFVGGPFFSWSVLAASEAATVIAECQKRTGMSAETCVDFIKRYMNVERCQSYTKLSASECEKKLEAVRRSPEFRDQTSTPTSPQNKPAPKTIVDPSVLTSGEMPKSLSERATMIKREKAERFALIREETEQIMAYIRKQGGEVAPIEERLKQFEERERAVLQVYDQYIRLTQEEDWQSPDALREPRLLVGQVLQEAVGYYRTELLPLLRQSVAP